ncbi:MAG: Fic family protein [Legionellales bacterium]
MSIETENGAILKAIATFPEGASLQEIKEISGILLHPKALQRRLKSLSEAGQIDFVGETRARRYFLPPELILTEQTSPSIIPLSAIAKVIARKVTQDIKNRTSVEYNRSFLTSYQPNITYYLSVFERELLLEMGTPFASEKKTGTFVKNIFNHLLLDLSWNSSRLEGNTYSLLETEQLLNTGKIAENKNPLDAQMLLNHKAAIEFLVDQQAYLQINSPTILNLHALLSYNLLGNPSACGRIRSIPVGISKTVYHPSTIPQIIQECFGQILTLAHAILDPFEQAFFLMVHLPYLQPFEDVNKRVSRLAANIPFIRENLCPLSFIDVPEKAYIEGILGIYELNKIELLKDIFIWAYQRSCEKYSTVQHLVGQPDLIHFNYLDLVINTIRESVSQKMNKSQTILYIADTANKHVKETDRKRFIEIIDRELMSLHEGNIAIYKITVDQFHAWQQQWKD